jgi:anti-sigma B factor antagonist
VDLKILQRRVGTTVLVAPEGEVDLASSEQLREGLIAAESAADASMVIDLRGVGFIDSTGIGELVGCQRRCKDAEVSLAFVVPDGTIRKILHVTGMDAVFDLHREESAAVASVAGDE